ncbi:efflux RND transporter periplasmic adaptor subunit [Hansschlegelia sp.]|uniref:efflux RND transporter periplasmic adaptor subunit n=1 Tax=Hansschlegelia sp. TaxID=2041892 RepID=UPI002BC31176|nr:efflux RND transporter periplasmic adaptor subunit [Hansschlegelia sp.]HVI29512.1 efflux RND transporter periplasmic adaptor subunit [Hansschlegelia sp.]
MSAPSRKRRWPWLLALALLGAGAAAYAYRDEIAQRIHANRAATAHSAATAESAAPAPPAITVATAVRREIAQTITVTGTLVARDEIMVGAQIDGLRLVSYLVDIGDRVERGQVLARLDRDMLTTQLAQNASQRARAEAAIAQVRAAIAEAEASRVDAEAALTRAETLKRTGNVTEELLQTRQTAMRVAEARLRAQNENLRVAESEKALAEAQGREIELRLARTEVRAPAAGVVSDRAARVGQTVGMAGEPLFRLVRDGEVELEAEVTETRLHAVAAGQTARIQVAGFPDPVEAKVRLVAPTVDAATRLGKIKIALPADPDLRPGLFARGAVEVARRDGVVVPQSAVLFGASGPRVQIVTDGVVAERSVETGLQDAAGVEIVRGVSEGESVVARAGGFLREGDRVTAVAAPEVSADAAPAVAER